MIVIISLIAQVLEIEKLQAQDTTVASPVVRDSQFNPGISAILDFSFVANRRDLEESNEIAGFEHGFAEGSLEERGFSLGHFELYFSGAIDPSWYGSLAFAYADNTISIEEAYLQTLGLPNGASIKIGRLLPIIGYLNEHHLHTDYFIFRPLPNQVFLGGSYIDDGIQIAGIGGDDIYVESGIGLYRGGNYPATEENSGEANSGSGNFFLRFGGDALQASSWRVGFSYLESIARNRVTPSHAHEAEGEGEEDDESITFDGRSRLFAFDIKTEWAPNRNFANGGFEWRFSIFSRSEEGDFYAGNFVENSEELPPLQPISTNIFQTGWYTSFIYKVNRHFSFGYQYETIFPDKTLPSGLEETVLVRAVDPTKHTLQFQYSFSEFSRIRINLIDQRLAADNYDSQIAINFIASLGSHGAHKY